MRAEYEQTIAHEQEKNQQFETQLDILKASHVQMNLATKESESRLVAMRQDFEALGSLQVTRQQERDDAVQQV